MSSSPSSALTLVRCDDATIRDRVASDQELREVAKVRDYFGRSDRDVPGPQGYLVERFPPNSTARAHYHPSDQFQIFLPSTGAWYQRTPLEHVLVHYADRYVTYGPFGSGEEPLEFFTLRAAATTDIGFMPEHRDGRLEWPARRHLKVPLSDRAIPPSGETRLEALVEPHPDGLAMYRLVAGPSADVAFETALGACRRAFVCVLSGALMLRGASYGPRSLGWFGTGGQGSEVVTSGAAGADVLLLRFPDEPPDW